MIFKAIVVFLLVCLTLNTLMTMLLLFAYFDGVKKKEGGA